MTNDVPLNQSAVQVFRNMFESESKILVLGGTGWFGRTALAMLRGLKVRTHIIAQNKREFRVDGARFDAHTWNEEEVIEFQPEAVLDFAYVTVDKAEALGLEAYRNINGVLAERLFFYTIQG